MEVLGEREETERREEGERERDVRFLLFLTPERGYQSLGLCKGAGEKERERKEKW